ncbi:MAG: hypothetical protein KIS82_05305 [Ferruginibacter sp.]|nr:hypothetical protein [Bacteroidota bacterium]MCW5916748.1 hypothetical protein [Ferruginibacter sp.]
MNPSNSNPITTKQPFLFSWKLFPAIFIFFLLFLNACKKDGFIGSPNASVSFSADTLKFDTVFTSTGSITQSFKIFNNNDQKIRFSEIRLMGGSASAYKININGNNTISAQNIELAANDSLYIFVNLRIDPSTANLPFIITDSIKVAYNGNERFVQLEAYGQNAHFLNNVTLHSNTTWENDLPYVILGGLTVDTSITLTIDAGCRIYNHANAPVIVHGTLLCNGTKTAPVVFRSNRLDDPYRDFPAGWPGIIFSGVSTNNILRFTEIRNAYQGIVLDGPAQNSNPKLTLHQCTLNNIYDAGVLSLQSSISADNTLISNCGKNLLLVGGGNYQFTNCTIASFSNSYLLHTNPVLTLTDSYEGSLGTISGPLSASFINNIFWGSDSNFEDEVVVNKTAALPFDVSFHNCIYKGTHEPPYSTLLNNIPNQYPAFDSIDVTHGYYDFRTANDPLAPGINNGTLTPFPKDLDDLPRVVEITDIGAYEKQ